MIGRDDVKREMIGWKICSSKDDGAPKNTKNGNETPMQQWFTPNNRLRIYDGEIREQVWSKTSFTRKNKDSKSWQIIKINK